MNNILDKDINPCCSCGVCAITCPQKCIDVTKNADGFYRPVLNEEACTRCGLCKKVCYKYIIRPDEFINFFKDTRVYGAWSKDKYILATSASGGVGHELLKWGIENGYKTCGVIFDVQNDSCKHTIATRLSEIDQFKTSKYLQSYTVDAFSQFKKSEKYIVVGTPCQIYGLGQLVQINKRDEDFILIDFFCHGTPTSLLWEKYKNYIQSTYNLIHFKSVCFRNKENSTWHKNSMKISDENGKSYYLKDKALSADMFFKFFLSAICLNESCYDCLLRLDYCASDIRIADFWGKKYVKNKEGVTLMTINTKKGNFVFDYVKSLLETEECSFSDLQDSQPKRFQYVELCKREKVINLLKSSENLNLIYRKTIAISFIKRLIRLISKIIMNYIEK